MIIISFFCGLMIAMSKGQKRFDWLVCSILLVSLSVILIQKPQLPSHRFFVLCFWISVIYRKEYRGKAYPMTIPLILYAVGMYIIGYHAQELSTFSKIWKPTSTLIDTYLIGLLLYYGSDKIKINSKPIIFTLYIVTLYGIFTLITRSNPYIDLIEGGDNAMLSSDYLFGDRLRITSTWGHPISYGFVCGMFFYLLLPYWKENKIMQLEILLAFNMLVSGSRTAFAAFILMGGMYVLLRYKVGKSLVVGVWTLVVCALLYFTVPLVQSKIDQLVATINGTDQTNGSSTDMRLDQTDAALFIFAQTPVYGHGLDYVQEQLMPNNQMYWQQGLHFYGFESYSYIILIERGILGVIIELVMWISMIVYALRKRKKFIQESAYIISLLVGFIFFALSTGILGTLEILMIYIGISMNRMYSMQKNNLAL